MTRVDDVSNDFLRGCQYPLAAGVHSTFHFVSGNNYKNDRNLKKKKKENCSVYLDVKKTCNLI